MLLWILLILNFIGACYFGINAPFDLGWNIILAAAIYIGGTFLYVGICALLSLLLGRTDKFVLRKKTNHKVVYIDSDLLTLADTGETVMLSDISRTIYSEKLDYPILRIEEYNIGGWRKKWLLELYKSRYNLILFLPIEKAQD